MNTKWKTTICPACSFDNIGTSGSYYVEDLSIIQKYYHKCENCDKVYNIFYSFQIDMSEYDPLRWKKYQSYYHFEGL